MSEKRELVTWRGTPGVGDFMWALNCAHLHAIRTGVKIDLEMHWDHDDKYNHHFEDPETIIERMQYMHRFYAREQDVKIWHVLNADGRYRFWRYQDDTRLNDDGTMQQIARNVEKARFYFDSGVYTDETGGTIPDNQWLFREDAFQPTIGHKIVLWRPTFNAEIPRTWKRLCTNDDWNVIIERLKAYGFHVVELTYRTPIREAVWHIANCKMVLCYDGMWHYVAKNFAKPTVVISEEGITGYHTPHAMRVSHNPDKPRSIWYWLDNIPDMIGKAKRKAVLYENEMKGILNAPAVY